VQKANFSAGSTDGTCNAPCSTRTTSSEKNTLIVRPKQNIKTYVDFKLYHRFASQFRDKSSSIQGLRSNFRTRGQNSSATTVALSADVFCRRHSWGDGRGYQIRAAPTPLAEQAIAASANALCEIILSLERATTAGIERPIKIFKSNSALRITF
jgi:hypothetical protein